MGKLIWGLIGCGDISQKRVAPALRELENSNLAAVSRKQSNLAESFAHEFGASKWYDKWQDLVQDPEIQAVYIATPVYLHKEMTLLAAQNGKHVLCEKPMAMNVDECNEMIHACKENHVQLGIAYYRHFYPVIDRIKVILKSKEIGKPVYATINVFSFFDRKPDEPRGWLNVKKYAGAGPLFDIGSHRAEVFHHLFGNVQSAKGMMSTQRFERDVEDTATGIYQYENGMQAVLHVTHAAFEEQDTLDIFCTEGSLHVSNLNQGDLRILSKSGERSESHAPHANLHQPLIDKFSQSVCEDRPFAVNGKVGLEVNQMLELVLNE